MYITKSPTKVSIKGYKGDDCTINAIGNALNISYDLARKVVQTGRYFNEKFDFHKDVYRTKKEFTESYCIKNICDALSDGTLTLLYRGIPFSEFAEERPEGTYILMSKDHLASVVNGKLVDTWDSSKEVIEFAYIIEIEKAREAIAELAKYYNMNTDKHFCKELNIGL